MAGKPKKKVNTQAKARSSTAELEISGQKLRRTALEHGRATPGTKAKRDADIKFTTAIKEDKDKFRKQRTNRRNAQLLKKKKD